LMIFPTAGLPAIRFVSASALDLTTVAEGVDGLSTVT
jgi:hypothetical protein